MEDVILEALKQAKKPLKIRELAKLLNLAPQQKNELKENIKNLLLKGKLAKIKGNKIAIPELVNAITGKFSAFKEGFGFVDPISGSGKGIFIKEKNFNGAMNGDIVTAQIIKHSRNGKKEGEVVSIIERANKKLVGRIEKYKNICFLIPEDKRIRYRIKLENSEDIEDGDYAVVEITSYPTSKKPPEGKIIEKLKESGAKLDIEIIIKKYDLPAEFPKKVLEEADKIPEAIPEEEISKRIDLREQMCFTIDGKNAKDFDDAVAIEKTNGFYKLFVHIADVSYYVKENSELDREAYKRGTSIYLPDRCIPMLPEKLSNGVCSLKPYEDRLTFTCEMTIDRNGNITNYEIYESIIRSKARLTYTTAQKILDGDIHSRNRFPQVVEHLKNMYELAKILNTKRVKRGSIDFDLPEPVIILNAEGEPIDIYRSERMWSHRIIEEFMIAANETVAEFMYWTDQPSIYRVHELPDREKFNQFISFIKSLGIKAPLVKGDIKPKLVQQILKQVEDKPEEKLVNYLCLRTMARAKYSPDNLGHFGLASKNYTHFTSPIRRYADLKLHRLIKNALKGRFLKANSTEILMKLERICRHITERDIIAEDAERDAIEIKQLRFAEKHIGEVFEGIITGVYERGIFVETIEYLLPGFVHVSDIKDDYYTYIQERHLLVGRKRGKTFRIGDRLFLKLVSVDIEDKKANFIPIKDTTE